MTSTPASRSARATTFAPRSWPSSPTLATITRILPTSASLVDAGNSVRRGDRAALRSGGGQGRGRTRRRGRGADVRHGGGVRAEQDLHVAGRDRRARRGGHVEQRRDLAGGRRGA